jgi:hypothetical protein
MASDKERQEAIEAARAIIAKMNALDPEERARLEELLNKNESVFIYIQTLAGAASGAGCALSGDRRSTASQMRATAALRLLSFLTGFKPSNGATHAKLFQVSASLDTGHSAVSLASSFAVENDCDWSAPAGSPASAVMLLSESIVNVVSFSFAVCHLRSSHSSLRLGETSSGIFCDCRDRGKGESSGAGSFL